MIRFSTRSPSVSVVMPVYNAGLYLTEAIQSILNQTFPDFEYIIVDDGSSDQSSEIIASFRDKRIIPVQNTCNVGNYPSRNSGMELARGKYICVMDADDIALPLRLEAQFDYMEKNPETGICGSFIQIIPSGRIPKFIAEDHLLKVAFLSNNYCSHPSLILRKESLAGCNIRYNEIYRYSADFDLCAQGFRHFKVQNIPMVLLRYRQHTGQISSAKFSEQQEYADKIRINQLIENLGFKHEEIPAPIHLQLMKKQPVKSELKPELEQWITQIIEKNRNCGYYKEKLLRDFLTSLMNISLKSDRDPVSRINTRGVFK